MFPLRDLNPSRSTPWVTYAILALNIAVFVHQVQLRLAGGDQAYAGFVTTMGLVPDYLMSPSLWGRMPVPAPLTILTSMFVHGGLLHLAGNMLYLWVFADNVEDAMGPVRFVLFYLMCGFAAAASQVMLMPHSPVPMVGASGAIAGVLGAYLVLYPRAQVLTLIFLIFIVRLVYLPAVVLLGLWFIMQVLSAGGTADAGVAFFAHIGGFAVGALSVRAFVRRSPPVRVIPL